MHVGRNRRPISKIVKIKGSVHSSTPRFIRCLPQTDICRVIKLLNSIEKLCATFPYLAKLRKTSIHSSTLVSTYDLEDVFAYVETYILIKVKIIATANYECVLILNYRLVPETG